MRARPKCSGAEQLDVAGLLELPHRDVQLAVRALSIAADEATVTITVTGYARDLLSELQQ